MTTPRIHETVSLHSVMDNLLRPYVLTKRQPTRKILDKIRIIADAVFSKKQIVTDDFILQRVEKLGTFIEKLDVLRRVDVIVQRSPEWHAMRQTLVTASDLAQALNCGKFGTQKDLYRKKVGYEDIPFNGNMPPLKWGCRFEQVACDLYSKRNSVTVHDFGLLRHPSILHFGASPDGITDLGIMLEIKCPFMRKITGEVPEQYLYQIQGQLAVCDLEECDYLEVGLKTYCDADQFFENRADAPFETGVLVEYEVNGNTTYIHGQVDGSDEYYRDWMKQVGGFGREFHFWYVDVYNSQRIYRDDAFLKEKFLALDVVWDKIQAYKGDRSLYDAEVGVKVVRKRSSDKPIKAVTSLPKGFLLIRPDNEEV